MGDFFCYKLGSPDLSSILVSFLFLKYSFIRIMNPGEQLWKNKYVKIQISERHALSHCLLLSILESARKSSFNMAPLIYFLCVENRSTDSECLSTAEFPGHFTSLISFLKYSPEFFLLRRSFLFSISTYTVMQNCQLSATAQRIDLSYTPCLLDLVIFPFCSWFV